jgi:hypothetical protein
LYACSTVSSQSRMKYYSRFDCPRSTPFAICSTTFLVYFLLIVHVRHYLRYVLRRFSLTFFCLSSLGTVCDMFLDVSRLFSFIYVRHRLWFLRRFSRASLLATVCDMLYDVSRLFSLWLSSLDTIGGMFLDVSRLFLVLFDCPRQALSAISTTFLLIVLVQYCLWYVSRRFPFIFFLIVLVRHRLRFLRRFSWLSLVSYRLRLISRRFSSIFFLIVLVRLCLRFLWRFSWLSLVRYRLRLVSRRFFRQIPSIFIWTVSLTSLVGCPPPFPDQNWTPPLYKLALHFIRLSDGDLAMAHQWGNLSYSPWQTNVCISCEQETSTDR